MSNFTIGLNWIPLFLFLVSFITKSYLTYSFFHPYLLYQPHLGLCQAACVQSHQRQPMSAEGITACEVPVSAADSRTVPTVATGVSKPLYSRLTLTFTLTSENLSWYTTLLFLLSLYNYAAHAADILTPTSVVQGVDNKQMRFVLSPLLICVCRGRFSRIFHFARGLGQLSTDLTLVRSVLSWPSPRAKWESAQVTSLPPGWCLLA